MQPSTSTSRTVRVRGPVLTIAAAALLLAACGRDANAPPAAATATPSAANTDPAASAAATPPAANAATPVAWRADALDELLAPIALYPDALLGQMLAASVNAQEVLDGGNWLLQNQSLKGKALDQAAEKAGFGPAMRALFAFPEVVDMMCQNLDWTTQLGEAFDADQAAVLDSVQRLRTRAVNAGTFKSTPQQTVQKQTVEAAGGAKKEVVVVEPANPQVVYVPKYDPAAVYQAAPVAATPAAPSSSSASSSSGSGNAVAAGLIGFGAGILIAEIFDDDDDWDDYYRPSWGSGGVYYGGRPWYGGTYVYAPTYVGYRPAGGYYRPATYPNRWDRPVNVGNVNVNVNNGNYFSRFPNNPNRPVPAGTRPARDSQARPALADASRPAAGAAERPALARDAGPPKVQGSYAGARGDADRPTVPTTAPRVPGQLDGKVPSRADGTQAGTRDRPAGAKPQGEYAGTRDRPATDRPGAARPAAEQPSPAGAVDRSGRDPLQASRELQRPAPDRGYGAKPASVNRPGTAQPRPTPQSRPAQANRAPQTAPGGAFGGASNRGGAAADRAASARGRASMGSASRPAPRGR